MSGPIKCFLLTPVGRCEVSFRRYRSRSDDDGQPLPESACPSPHGYHNASVVLGVEPYTEDAGGRHAQPDDATKADPRWPARCECGYEFRPDDQWQVSHQRLHARSDGGPECTLRGAPPGAMWDARWMKPTYQGPDGRCLVVRTPDGGEWMIDGPSYNGDKTVQATPGWTRTGEAPRITARPSILMHRTGYHAFLTDGVLVPC